MNGIEGSGSLIRWKGVQVGWYGREWRSNKMEGSPGWMGWKEVEV